MCLVLSEFRMILISTQSDWSGSPTSSTSDNWKELQPEQNPGIVPFSNLKLWISRLSKLGFCIYGFEDCFAGGRGQSAQARDGGVHRSRPDHVWAPRPLQKTSEPQSRLEAQRSLCFPGQFNPLSICRFDTYLVYNKIRRLSIQGWFTPGQVFVLDEYCARWILSNL